MKSCLFCKHTRLEQRRQHERCWQMCVLMCVYHRCGGGGAGVCCFNDVGSRICQKVLHLRSCASYTCSAVNESVHWTLTHASASSWDQSLSSHPASSFRQLPLHNMAASNKGWFTLPGSPSARPVKARRQYRSFERLVNIYLRYETTWY